MPPALTHILSDYKVEFRREDYLAGIALQWRDAGGFQNAPWFNIVRFITDILAKKIKRPFKIKFFTSKPGQKPAVVTFDGERTLHVDKDVWEQAELGDPDSVFILAHEVGHLIFHDHHAKSFSNDAGEQIEAWEKEYSAEWQANTFAFYFLLPSHLVVALGTVTEIARACGLSTAIVQQCLDWCEPIKPNCDICKKCGDFTNASGLCSNIACNYAA
jgi:hypothetical protein